MRPNRNPGGTLRLSMALAVLSALPGWALAAQATPEREAHASRFAIGNSALEREGEPSVSGRYRLDGDVSVKEDAAAARLNLGTRYGGGAKLVTVADCSSYVFADGFE